MIDKKQIKFTALLLILLIFPSIFALVWYNNSNSTNFKRFRTSFRIAVMISLTLISLSLNFENTKITRFFINDSPNNELESDKKIVLIKSNTNSPSGVNSFNRQAPYASSRPTRLQSNSISPSNPSVNPFRPTSKIVYKRQGLGLGGSGGSGSDDSDDSGNKNFEFNKNDLGPEKENSELFDYLYKKKKKSKENQCQLDENPGKIKIIIVDKIIENNGLIKQAERAINNQDARRGIESLIQQLTLGNQNPGGGIKKIKGLKNVFEARAVKSGGRLYFRKNKATIEILAMSDKKNQLEVLKLLKDLKY